MTRAEAGGAHDTGRSERGELQELAAIERALRRERHAVGATVRWEWRHETQFTPAPLLHGGGDR